MDVPSQMRSLSGLLEMKVVRCQTNEELQRAQIVAVEGDKLTKIPTDITILEEINDVTTTDNKHFRPALKNNDGRNYEESL